MFEHPQNIYLVEILKANLDIQDIQALEQSWLDANRDLDSSEIEAKKREYLKRTVESWIKLQDSINNLLDSSKAPLGVNGKAAPPGIRQLLEKKEGLFRKHMMGKRVNYACRSVISPDPYIETNEIGIPPVFAKKLTYPEAVTPHNFAKLRECVVNGPETWPGATHVQNEDGSLIALSAFDEQGRSAIANQLLTPLIQKNQAGACKIELILAHQFKNTNKKVYRHLRNGDFLLLNRQPTLHKPSIMAHTARVLPGERTIRMHYANCNTYNADFDGDEMNAHFPQNEIARAEAMIIARTDQQYLVPTDGGVLRGLIQDHVDAGVDMCSRDSFFTREEYIQLVYAGLREASSSSSVGNGNIEKHVIIGDNGRIQTHMPTIIKPFPLWTGKQIISTILENLTPAGVEQLNLISKSKIPAKQWGPTAPEEDVVLFMDGKLLTGILDKSQFGASGNGLVHAVYEIYGAPYASKLLSVLGRLFTAYLQKVGFSCRMDDLLLTREGNEARRNLIDTNSSMGTIVAKEFCGEEISLRLKLELEKVLRSSDKMAALDSAMKSKTNKVTSEIISTCIPDKLFKLFPRNNMQVMTVSGAKGSSVNVSQISCLLGQQELEGKRVPTMVSGKTLPSFQPYDPSSRAGGYITGRFLTGIKPQEYYFHCMAGREGLIDTAVKTSRSGYLQRCLIKGLEGIQVNYDNTVRDSDGSVLQFRYGEDSLDVCKQTTLKKFDFNALNYRALMKRYDPQRIDGKVDEKSAHKYCKKQKGNPNSDPVLSVFEPSSYIGAVSDKFKELLDDYLALNKAKLIKTKQNPPERSSWSGNLVTQTQFKTLMELKYMFSLVEPGESVGLLAAQSIGEPSTQMTLNTFHFAGFGAKNVTLGIPRLREIIMTASSSIKTPLMTLPLLDHVSASEKEQLCEQISKLVLSQIMKKVTVTETLSSRVSGRPRRKIFKVLMEFWEQKHYKKQYSIDAKHLNKLIENQFIYALERAISKLLKSSSREKDNIVDDIGVGVKERVQAPRVVQDDEVVQPSLRAAETAEASESDPESDEEGDGDATTARNRSKKMQQSTYDEDDEEKSDEQIDDPETDEPEIAEKLILDSKYVTGMAFDPSNNTFELTLDVLF
jgi:DNA-directed RNA polymerase I subunit RPA1